MTILLLPHAVGRGDSSAQEAEAAVLVARQARQRRHFLEAVAVPLRARRRRTAYGQAMLAVALLEERRRRSVLSFFCCLRGEPGGCHFGELR